MHGVKSFKMWLKTKKSIQILLNKKSKKKKMMVSKLSHQADLESVNQICFLDSLLLYDSLTSSIISGQR